MSEITPGRWCVSNGKLIRVVAADRQRPIVVCGIHNSGKNGGKAGGDPLANARLIAASPEMKDALRKLVNEVTGLAGFGPEIKALIGVTNWNVLEQRVQEARQAITKAEARS